MPSSAVNAVNEGTFLLLQSPTDEHHHDHGNVPMGHEGRTKSKRSKLFVLSLISLAAAALSMLAYLALNSTYSKFGMSSGGLLLSPLFKVGENLNQKSPSYRVRSSTIKDEDDEDGWYEGRSKEIEDALEDDEEMTWEIPLFSLQRFLGSKSKKHSVAPLNFTAPKPEKRCDYIIRTFQERDVGTLDDFDKTKEDLFTKYLAQTTDENVFYRATALIFWQDFALKGWGRGLTLLIEDREIELNNHGFAGAIAANKQNSRRFRSDQEHNLTNQTRHHHTVAQVSNQKELVIHSRSTWTWVTGDQHLSNFGAWRNRHGEVVFGLNDFDEGAIYDFNIDVLRIAVSIGNHAHTIGMKKKKVKRILNHFTKSYIDAVQSYFGNDRDQLFELTPKTSEGLLQDFLKKVEKKKSGEKQLQKFSTKDKFGHRHFIKSDTIGVPHNETNLAPVSPAFEAAVRAAFTSNRYGATMMKLGWAVPQWDNDFFAVVDVARRIGSGIGSYGNDRYYVLLNGTDGLLHYQAEGNDEDDLEGGAVILDMKYEPKGAVRYVLKPHDAAWYGVMFPNEAARVIEAQRRLTSYTDPFLGWVELPDDPGTMDGVINPNTRKPFYIRQRSPWKKGIEYADLFEDRRMEDYLSFVKQIAISTATSHVRGSPAKQPGDFKTVIKKLLKSNNDSAEPWQHAIRKLAFAYREQVLLDFQCTRDYVNKHVQAAAANKSDKIKEVPAEVKPSTDDAALPGADEGVVSGSTEGAAPGSEEATVPSTDDAAVPGLDESLAPASDESAASDTNEAAAPAEAATSGSNEATTPGSDEAVETDADEAAAAVETPGSDEEAMPDSDEEATPGSDEEATHSSDEKATPSSDETGTPSSDETGTPSSDETGTPSSDETGTPSSDEAATPAPVSDEAATPVDDEAATPVDDEAAAPSSDEAATSGTDEAATPGFDEAATPGSDEAAAPSSDETAAPGPDEAATPDSDEAAAPSSDEVATSGTDEAAGFDEAATPGSDEAAAPSSDETAAPGLDEAATPDSDESTTSGSDEAATPGSDEAATPGSDQPATPGSDEAATPGSDEAATPGSDEAATPGSDEAAPPGSDEAAPPGAATPGSDEAATPDSDEAAAPGLDETATSGPDEAATPGPNEAAIPDSDEAAALSADEDEAATVSANVTAALDSNEAAVGGADEIVVVGANETAGAGSDEEMVNITEAI